MNSLGIVFFCCWVCSICSKPDTTHTHTRPHTHLAILACKREKQIIKPLAHKEAKTTAKEKVFRAAGRRGGKCRGVALSFLSLVTFSHNGVIAAAACCEQ